MSHEDAQRELEQRALKNVRGLVDKIEQTDELDARKQKRVVMMVIAAFAVLAIAIGAWIATRTRTTEVVIDPAKLPPVKAGPQR